MLKLILADNQAIFRAGIAKVLAVEDDLRVVAQAQSTEQMMMALDKFRASVMIFSASFVPDIAALVQAANRCKTGLIVVAENGENSARYLNSGIAGLNYITLPGKLGARRGRNFFFRRWKIAVMVVSVSVIVSTQQDVACRSSRRCQQLDGYLHPSTVGNFLLQTFGRAPILFMSNENHRGRLNDHAPSFEPNLFRSGENVKRVSLLA